MNVQTITMPIKQAQEAYCEYRRAVLTDPNPTDVALMRGYKALSRGKAVLDLQAVMMAAGVDDKGRPRLAIARADAAEVWCQKWENGRTQFSLDRSPRAGATRRYVVFPNRTFPTGSFIQARAVVPFIPPRYRPRHALSNYHILWEAEWQDVPRDPILLRRLSGMLFAVLAQWDLTDLERSVLRGR